MRRLWVQLSFAFSAVVIISVTLLIVVGDLMSRVQGEQFRLQLIAAGEQIVQSEGGIIDQLNAHFESGGTTNEAVLILRNLERPNRILPLQIKLELMDSEGKVVYSSLEGEDSATEVSLIKGVLRYQITARGMREPPPPALLFHPEDGLIWLLLSGSAVGILGGILMSRRLSAPLSQLAEVARHLGSKDFSHRAELHGTEEMRDLARAFNEMADALQKSEQLRSNLIADVAHELRTPLTVMESSLCALVDDIYPLTKDEILRLSDQTRHLTRMVNDLHTLALADAHELSFNMVPTDVNVLVKDVAEIFAPVAESEGIIVKVETESEPCMVEADVVRLRQVLQNMLVNAFRHSSPGGVISLTSQKKDNGLVIRVADTGTGIPAEHVAHVFERFYRAEGARDRASGGAGLGLAIGKSIIEAHKGRISVESQTTPPSGTHFTITLPLISNV
ncbi:MAG: HAMP domain-containing protein [Anaerolineae bacterium]|nr:HAMP domain-containing protein [Anaerolineae bacterium]